MTAFITIAALFAGAALGFFLAALVAGRRREDLERRLAECHRDLWQVNSENIDARCDLANARRELEMRP